MVIRGCNTRRSVGRWAMSLASAVVAGPALAFSPFSGPIEAASAVPPNVTLLVDNTSLGITGAGDDVGPAAAGDAVSAVLGRHRYLRVGLFGLREPSQGETGPVGVMLADVSAADGDAGATLSRALSGLRPVAGGSTAALAAAWRSAAEYPGDPESNPQTLRCQHNLGLILAGTQAEDQPPAFGAGELEEQARRAWESDLNLRTSTVALSSDDAYLQVTAAAGRGEHVRVVDQGDLESALAVALAAMTSVAGTMGSAGGGTGHVAAAADRLYRTTLDATDWSSSLRAYRLNEHGVPADVLWDTDDSFLPGSPAGHFETWRRGEGGAAGAGVALDGGTMLALGAAQRQLLQQEAVRAGLGSDEGQRLLDWVRGGSDVDLRRRDRLLGDVIRSTPVVVGAGHHVLPAATVGSYESYLSRRRGRMPEAVLLGSNDGFVRLFASDGRHLYSYLPAAAHRGLGARARPDYLQGYHHRSGVDGRLAVGDVHLGSQWATVAAGGLGAGGRAVFALRLFSESADIPQVLWERDAAEMDALGHVYGQPQFAQLGDRAVLILGNGYGSVKQQAALLVLDLLSGDLLAELPVAGRQGAAGGNGLSTPVLQFDADGVLRAAIAGDLHGQLWKFELAGNDPTRWRVAGAGIPLFTTAPGQPITVQPTLLPRFTGDGDLILFGTGRLMEAGDLADTQAQAFYALLDAPDVPAGLAPAALQKQQLRVSVDPASGRRIRSVDASPVDWSSRHGWYLPFDGVAGERVVHEAVLRHSRVLFPTTVAGVAAADPCATHGGGWLMSVMVATGGMPPVATLDVTGDLQVDADDVPAAGLELPAGMPGGLTLIELADPARPPGCAGERYLMPGGSETAVLAGEPRCRLERVMWRQLQ